MAGSPLHRFTRRSRPPHVALLVETSTSFGRRLLRGVAHYVRENGPWSVYLEQRSIYDPAPPWLKRWDGDGIISRAAYPELARQVVRLGVPTVDLNEQVLGLGLPLIFNDNPKIGLLAAEHLLERGFTRFGYIGHPGVFWSDRRRDGFVERVRAAGYPCDEYQGKGPTLPRYHQRSWEKEMDDVGAWVRRLPKPVGVMACNDFRGVQLLDACRRTGTAVPEQVAVIGVDDETVACSLAHPPLSSVVPDAVHLGYEAAALLDACMAGRTPACRELYVPPIGVVTRQSTDILAIRDPMVAAALRFIREHACEGTKVKDVLDHLVTSRSVLQRRFKRELNQSIHDVLIDARLARVKELLVETDLSRDQIAARTGFPHAEYLSNVFHQRTGTVLSVYRRAAQQSR